MRWKPGLPVKIVIVSDMYANAESLQVLPTDYDELWVPGDLVYYGPVHRQSSIRS